MDFDLSAKIEHGCFPPGPAAFRRKEVRPTLVLPETRPEASRHARKCNKRRCARCSWNSGNHRHRTWLQLGWALAAGNIPPEAVTMSTTSWCASAFSNGRWGLGCVACAKLRSAGAFGNFKACRGHFKPTLLRRHAASKIHRAACTELLGAEGATGPTGGSVAGSPGETDFVKLLDHLVKGRSLASLCSTSSKGEVMQWCLHEALKEVSRDFLKSASTIVLCRDEREGQLAVRFRAANDELKTHAGLLGIATDCGGKATQISQATRIVLKRMHTTHTGCPGNRLKPKRCKDEEVRTASKIEVIVNDSASSEMLAGSVGRGRRAAQPHECDAAAGYDPRLSEDVGVTLTPNVILIARDWAHSFRRTTNPTNNANTVCMFTHIVISHATKLPAQPAIQPSLEFTTEW